MGCGSSKRSNQVVPQDVPTDDLKKPPQVAETAAASSNDDDTIATPNTVDVTAKSTDVLEPLSSTNTVQPDITSQVEAKSNPEAPVSFVQRSESHTRSVSSHTANEMDARLSEHGVVTVLDENLITDPLSVDPSRKWNLNASLFTTTASPQMNDDHAKELTSVAANASNSNESTHGGLSKDTSTEDTSTSVPCELQGIARVTTTAVTPSGVSITDNVTVTSASSVVAVPPLLQKNDESNTENQAEESVSTQEPGVVQEVGVEEVDFAPTPTITLTAPTMTTLVPPTTTTTTTTIPPSAPSTTTTIPTMTTPTATATLPPSAPSTTTTIPPTMTTPTATATLPPSAPSTTTTITPTMTTPTAPTTTTTTTVASEEPTSTTKKEDNNTVETRVDPADVKNVKSTQPTTAQPPALALTQSQPTLTQPQLALTPEPQTATPKQPTTTHEQPPQQQQQSPPPPQSEHKSNNNATEVLTAKLKGNVRENEHRATTVVTETNTADVDVASNMGDAVAPADPHKREREDYNRKLLFWVKHQEGSEEADHGFAIGTSSNKEYSLGGTKEMYEEEKDFGQAMVGPEVDVSTFTNPKPARPTWFTEADGKWLRTMNLQDTCYLYVHSFTEHIVSTRPQDAGPYPEDHLEVEAPKESKKPPFPSCSLDAIVNEISQIEHRGKTALILATGNNYAAVLKKLRRRDGRNLPDADWDAEFDQKLAEIKQEEIKFNRKEEENKIAAEVNWIIETKKRKLDRQAELMVDYASSDEEFEYHLQHYPGPDSDGTYVIDCKPFVLPFKRTKIKFSDHMEKTRTKIRRCMIAGGTLVIDINDLAPDFVDHICSPKYKGAFPLGLFNVKQRSTCAAGVFIRAKGEGAPNITPGFTVVVVANQESDKYVKLLQKDLGPEVFDHLEAIEIEH